MFNTIGAALAIATGASFGILLGQPLHRHITRNRNLSPVGEFMRAQISADRKAAKLMAFIPRRLTKRD